MIMNKACDDKGNYTIIQTGHLGDPGLLYTCRTLFQTGLWLIEK